MYTIKLKTILAGPNGNKTVGDTMQAETLDLVEGGFAELVETVVDEEAGGAGLVDEVPKEPEPKPEPPRKGKKK